MTENDQLDESDVLVTDKMAQFDHFFPFKNARTVNAFLRKIKHSFLQLHFLYPFVVSEAYHQRILTGEIHRNLTYFVRRLLEKSLWFWPRAIEARHWAAGKPGERYTPINFLSIDETSTVLIDAVERTIPDRNASILDLGCNAGRHLNALRERGYTNLHGVDAMGSAFATMRETFPDTYVTADVKHDLFQSFLVKKADRCFDAVYTHGATIELVHPSFNIVGHIARVTKFAAVILIDAISPRYYQRFWIHEFERNGFHLFKCVSPVSAEYDALRAARGNLSLFVFVRVTD